jgi:hypothetical protein
MSKVLGIGCLHLKAQLSRKELEDSWNRVHTFHRVITYKLRISGREPPKPWTSPVNAELQIEIHKHGPCCLCIEGLVHS